VSPSKVNWQLSRDSCNVVQEQVGYKVNEVFKYQEKIQKRFPDLVGGVIRAAELDCTDIPPELKKLYLIEQATAFDRYGDKALSEIASLAAWRRAFRAFGVNPTKYRSASEALLRRLTKKGDIPSINLLVDIANLVSIRYALPVAIFDTRLLKMPVTVGFAEGSEQFIALGQKETEQPDAGEVIFTDESRNVVARRWCWRQSSSSAATSETVTAVITVEAQHTGGMSAVEKALSDLLTYLSDYGGGVFNSAILG
jgi:DNA/RNA-binding domain of Phe-tRNA-synthetase-like protein